MKILAFCPYYPPHVGGLEKYAQELHSQLAKANHSSLIWTPNIPRSAYQLTQPNLQILRFPAYEIIHGYPLPKIWHPLFWQQLKTIRSANYDVVFSVTRFFVTSPMALLYSKLTRTPWLHIEHGSDFVNHNPFVAIVARLVDETVGRLTFLLSDHNIAPSQSAARFIARFTTRPSTVIYRGLSLDHLKQITPDTSLRHQHARKQVITYAGRFIEGKGLPDLIHAVAKLPPEKYILLLIGSGSTEQSLRQLVQKLQLGTTIQFIGEKNHQQTLSLLKASDIVVNPSYNEGLPTTILEAAALGRAIVATNVGGTPEIITHQQSGLLYKPGDIAALHNHLQQLLTIKPLTGQLGEAAQRQVASRFSWPRATQQYQVVISKLIRS